MKQQRTIRSAVLALLLVTLAGATAPLHAETVIKMATLAPERSAWDKVFRAFQKDLEKESGGALSLKIYAGGVQGDEAVVVRKMKTGQIGGAAITGVGLGAIAPEVLVLQLPGLFDGYAALDRTRTALAGELERTFSDKGYKLLGWGDVGFAYMFSNVPVRSPDDLKKVKMWTWSSDPIANELARAAGANPIPLGVPDVLPSLNTGLVDGFYASPLAAIALQWFTKVKYMTGEPVAMGIGATVISNATWSALSADEQKILERVADKWHRILIKKVRQDNAKSIKLLEGQGIQVVELSDADRAAWRRLAETVQTNLTDKVYPASLLEQVKKLAAQR